MRSRMLSFAAAVVLATGGGVAVSSCGGDEDKSTVDVAKAAKATAAKGTAEMTMNVRLRGLGLPEPIAIAAKGVTALAEPRARFSIDLGPLLALVGAPAGGDRDLEMIVDGADVYARPPRIDGLTIPGDKPWVALDLRALARAAGLPTEGLGALFNIDPASQLRALRAAKGIQEVGEEEVGGAETTHLKGSYRISDIIAGLPRRDRGEARKALKELERIGGQGARVNDPLRADIWIDDAGVTRRMRATSKVPAQAGTPPGSFVISYVLRDFGAELDTTGPPASERYDATGALEDSLKRLAGRR